MPVVWAGSNTPSPVMVYTVIGLSSGYQVMVSGRVFHHRVVE